MCIRILVSFKIDLASTAGIGIYEIEASGLEKSITHQKY